MYRLRFVDIWEASTDPLIRAMRHQLRVRHGVRDGVPVLLSTERPRCKLVMTPQQEEAESIRDYQARPAPYASLSRRAHRGSAIRARRK